MTTTFFMAENKRDNTGINRREFIDAVASVLPLGGCSTAVSIAKKPEFKFIWSYLAHLGVNS
jgi:hypothetical protein